MGTADGASLLLDPILVLSGPPVAWLAPIEAATKLAVKVSIQQAMSDAKRAKKDAWVCNAFLQAAIVSSRIMFTVRPALCKSGACLGALQDGHVRHGPECQCAWSAVCQQPHEQHPSAVRPDAGSA